MLKMIVVVLAALSRVAVAGAIGDIAPKKMSFQQAYEYCSNQNSRLPTIHEYAEFAMEQGAVGILASEYPDRSAWDSLVVQEFDRIYEKGYGQLIYHRAGNQSVDPKGNVFYGGEAQLLDGQGLEYPYSVRCFREAE